MPTKTLVSGLFDSKARDMQIRSVFKAYVSQSPLNLKKVTILLGSVLDNIGEYCFSKKSIALNVKMFSSGITKYILEEPDGMFSDKTGALIIHRQIFRKANISYPLIRTPTCVYQGVRNVRFS